VISKKYEFTEDRHSIWPQLRRIRRIADGAIGGWIEAERNLSHDGAAWVSGDARVFGGARVSGAATVSGAARVFGDARVFEGARVFEAARVSGAATVFGDATVFGGARVFGDARVSGAARVFGDAMVSGGAWVFGDARVFGDAMLSGATTVFGGAMVSGVVKFASRSDGYQFTLFPCADGVWRLTAGCRYFTMEQAWKHWTTTRVGKDLGEETLDILVLFEHHIDRVDAARAKP
jgi:hypothetical protein